MGRTLVANKLLACSACGKRQRGRPLNAIVREHMIRFGIYLALFAMPHFAWALSAAITATLEGGDRPMVVGRTNLPDGMEFGVTVMRRDNSYIAQSKAVVSAGQFRAGPFSEKGAPLGTGTYQIEVTSPLASLQSPSVRTVIGQDGEKLDGPLAKTSMLGHGKVLEYEVTVTFGTARNAANSDRARRQAKLDATKQLAAIIRHGRAMERLRRDDLGSAAECGRQMREWQPKAKALDKNLVYGNLKAAAGQAISCVSCLSDAKSYCDQAAELIRDW